jgi:serine/threonine-protein kinase
MDRGTPGLPEGTVVASRYRIIREIGSGGMGVVYEAEHVRLAQRFALKVLGGDLVQSPELARRFEREARTLARLESPHIARVTDVDVAEGGAPFIAMELLHGNDLDQEIERRGRLPWREAAQYVLQACRAMSAAHAHGIVHRDLKPANLFLHESEEGRIVKVLDFGISKITTGQDVSVTLTQSPIGTPLYMSPEQMTRPKEVDVRTDVWALGVVLYETLTARAPFEADTPQAVAILIATKEPAPISSIAPDVPAALEAVVARAIEKDPAERFPSVAALASALEAVLGGAPAYDTDGPHASPASVQIPQPARSRPGDRSRDPLLETTVPLSRPIGRAPAARRRWIVLGAALGLVAAGVGWALGRDGTAAVAVSTTDRAAATAPTESAGVAPPFDVAPSPSPAVSEPAPEPSASAAPSASHKPARARTARPPATAEPAPFSTGKAKPPTRL